MENTKNTVIEVESEKVAPKKKKKRIFLKVLAVLLAVIVAFVGVTTIITAVGLSQNIKKAKTFAAAGTKQLKLDNYANGCWNIYSDDGIKVLQLTDVHIGGGWMSTKKDSMAINAVAAMITAEKPDFVIVTGDVAYPVPFQAGTFNNKSGAKVFAETMEALGVYWTLSFGNHDTEAYSYYSREEITEFYSSGDYPHCLLQSGSELADGSGNQVFNVVNSDSVVTRSFIVLDSHSYVDGDYLGIDWKYDNIHENQITWYSDTVKALSESNAQAINKLSAEKRKAYENLKTVPTSLFFHIPISEYRDAWNEYMNNGYKDTDDVKLNFGVVGEKDPYVYCGVHEDNLFETMQSLGSTDSIFCGHDHLNNFSLNYKGINLTYGMSIDYLAYSGIYKLGTQRGCMVINYSSDGKLEISQQNYYQEKYSSQYEKEPVTMQPLGQAQ